MESELAPIAKEYWMPDESTKACTTCDRLFTAIRRKHHCRVCGLIYCSDCCEVVRHGKETSRMCLRCQRSSSSQSTPSGQAPLSPHFPNTESSPKSQMDSSPLQSSDYSDVDTGNPYSQSQDYCQTLLALECDRLFQDTTIPPDWKPLILKFVKQAVDSISLETYPRGDEMDINHYLRIVKLVHKDSTLSEYFNGVAFLKNIAHKKMKVKIPNPSILILAGGAEFSSGEQRVLSMESILDQEPDFTKLFMRKLAKIKPQLVIVEKSMSQWIISELARFGVAAIINVQMKLIQLIARVTHGKPLNDIDQATQVKNCIGHCSEMVIKPYQKSGVVYLRTHSETALGGSIVLTGPDVSTLRQIKRLIRDLSTKYRNWKLESSFLTQMKVGLFGQLSDEMGTMNLMIHHLKVFGKMCQKPKIVALQLYSPCDKPLGTWIIDTLSGLSAQCAHCEGEQGLHFDYFLKKEGLVKLTYTVISTDIITGNDDISAKVKCSICAWESDEITLNTWSREWSFHRFLACFFIDERCEKMQCGHLLFRSAQITFGMRHAKVSFEYAQKPMFTLIPIKPTIQLSNYYISLAAKIISEAQTAARDLYQKLLQEAAQIKADIARIEVNTEVEIQGLEGLKTDANATYEVLIQSLSHCDESVTIEGLLAAEYWRRELFLDVCKHKVLIQAYKQSCKTFAGDRKSANPSRMIDWLNFIQALPEPEKFTEIEEKNQRNSREDAAVQTTKSRPESTVVVPRTWLPLDKSDSILTSESFEFLQPGCHTLPPGPNNTFTPVRESDPLSIIAYTINSQKHIEEVTRHFHYSGDVHEIIESELLSGSEFALECGFSTSNFPDIDAQNDLIRIYGPAISFHVTAYYARQFQAIRLYLSGSEGNFLQSIVSSTVEQVNLGKSGARFFKSHDEQFIAKIVEEKEFQMFVDMAPNYFRHICKTFYHNMPSRLVRTLGVYKVTIRNSTANTKKLMWVLLMENLGFGVNPKAAAYDLKGTLNSRRYVKEGERQTKMDLNFIEDMCGLPILIDFEAMSRLHSSIWNDTLFLYKQNVIDYSLILLVNFDECQIAAGIIDYLRQYTFDKAIESKYKKVIANELPTITNPMEYKDRFRTQIMQDYFLTLERR